MARSKKISELNELTDISANDFLIVNDVGSSDSTTDPGETKKIKFSNLGKKIEVSEIGSNANGDWIKYNDGTMICSTNISAESFTRQYYKCSTASWTYPVPFVDDDVKCIAIANDWTIKMFVAKVGVVRAANVNIMQGCIDFENGSIGIDEKAGITVIAKGKWKTTNS